MNPKSLLVFLSVLALAGCATTPAERIDRNHAAYASWPPDVQARVKAGEVVPGFTRAQVRVALGEPDHVVESTTENGTAEIWIYRDHRPRISVGVGVGGGGGSTRVGASTMVSTGGHYRDEVMRVVFEGGRVTEVEKTK